MAARLDGGAIGAWTLGFATVAYLGLKGGGYDVVVRSQAGIGVWWIVLIGAALGVLPQRRRGARRARGAGTPGRVRGLVGAERAVVGES